MLSQSLPTISALWIGGQLGVISCACLTSFLMRGHQVNLYTYDNLPDVPDGVTVCNANQIIHHSKIFKHTKKQSYGSFSDIFSYELLKKCDNTVYVDCDVYCLKPITIASHGYLFGYENDSLLNVAVLALPKNSKLLQALCNIGSTPNFVPKWYSPNRQLRLKIKRLFGKARHIADMSWGITGPSALTYYAKECGVLDYAQSTDVLYPIGYTSINQLFDKNLTITDISTENTVCVHLYNEVLKHKDLSTLEPNCILAKMLNNKI